MELRLIHKKENRELAFPFANGCKRETGSGRVEQYNDYDPVIMQDKRYVMTIRGAETKPYEGEIFTYLLLRDDNAFLCGEYCWPSDEWTGYLVDDNGKRIGRINS